MQFKCMINVCSPVYCFMFMDLNINIYIYSAYFAPAPLNLTRHEWLYWVGNNLGGVSPKILGGKLPPELVHFELRKPLNIGETAPPGLKRCIRR